MASGSASCVFTAQYPRRVVQACINADNSFTVQPQPGITVVQFPRVFDLASGTITLTMTLDSSRSLPGDLVYLQPRTVNGGPNVLVIQLPPNCLSSQCGGLSPALTLYYSHNNVCFTFDGEVYCNLADNC